MTDSTRDMLTRQVNSLVDTLSELRAAIDNGDEYEGQDAYDYLHESVLGVVDRRGEPFAVVFGIGGPHLEVEAHGWQSAYVAGYWGGERVIRHGDFDWVIDFFINREDES